MWLKFAQVENYINQKIPENLPPKYKDILSQLLLNLIDEAKNSPDFQTFKQQYSLNAKHGNYSHITHQQNFQIDPSIGPYDVATGSSSPGDLMVSTAPGQWLHWAGWEEDEENIKPKTENSRQFITFFRIPNPSIIQDPNRSNNEFMIPNAQQNAIPIHTLPLQEAIKLNDIYDSIIPQSEKELLTLWNLVHHA